MRPVRVRVVRPGADAGGEVGAGAGGSEEVEEAGQDWGAVVRGPGYGELPGW